MKWAIALCCLCACTINVTLDLPEEALPEGVDLSTITQEDIAAVLAPQAEPVEQESADAGVVVLAPVHRRPTSAEVFALLHGDGGEPDASE